MDKIKHVLSECLEKASVILKKYFAEITAQDIVTKSSHLDLQTIADTKAEQAIVKTIQAGFPDHSITTEEAGELIHPEAETRWIIDPLDGTCNFRHSYPNCAISIAVEFRGEIKLAAVFNPFRNELFEAEKDCGATCNGSRIHVATIKTLKESLLIAGFPYDRQKRMDHYIDLFKTFMQKSQGVLRTGSASMDLCQVAAGRVSAYYEESLSEWDWAAGQLIIKEAGGKVTDYHGEDKMLERSQICGSNHFIHEELLEVLRPSVILPP